MDTAGIRDLMWRSAGLFRSRARLQAAAADLEAACTEGVGDESHHDGLGAEPWRQFNLLTVARLVARAALRRDESRGGHFREDFPERDDLHWKIHLIDQRGNHGQ